MLGLGSLTRSRIASKTARSRCWQSRTSLAVNGRQLHAKRSWNSAVRRKQAMSLLVCDCWLTFGESIKKAE
jgi:hypothetical protein